MGRFTPGMKNFHRKGRGLGHVTFSKILYPFNISGMGEVTRLKFGKWIDYGKSHRRDEKLPMKGAWSESRDPFKNCKTPSIVLEWMKLRCLNLASKWIDYGKSHPKGKKIHPKRPWCGSRDRFRMQPCSLNFANASTMASATTGVRNSPSETGMVLVT